MMKVGLGGVLFFLAFLAFGSGYRAADHLNPLQEYPYADRYLFHAEAAYASYCDLRMHNRFDCFHCQKMKDLDPSFSFVGGFGRLTDATIGWTGFSKQNKTVFVVFRGTASNDGWKRNADARMETLGGGNTLCQAGAKIHGGFYKEARGFRQTFTGKTTVQSMDWYERMFEAVNKCRMANNGVPCKKLTFVGHSLGGSMATLASMTIHEHAVRLLSTARMYSKDPRSPKKFLKKWDYLVQAHATEGLLDGYPKGYGMRLFEWLPTKTELVTFGAPRVGNKAFVECFKSMGIKSRRFVFGADVVPHVPPRLMGFRHLPGEIWTDKESGKTYSCLVARSRYESDKCANSVSFKDYRIADHSKALTMESKPELTEGKNCGQYNAEFVQKPRKNGILGGYKMECRGCRT